MGDADLVVELEAAEHLTAAEADDFDYRCGELRADAVDRVLLRVVEGLGWSLFDDGVTDRVIVEHDGPTRARIVVDGRPASRWWNDRVRVAAGRRVWSFEPEPG
jgi:hypothetical protein